MWDFVVAGRHSHNLRRCPALAEQEGHQLHRLVDVLEESFVPRAEIVQSLLFLRRADKAVFRAAAVTNEAHLTFPAVTG